jgi:hypothetical protein
MWSARYVCPIWIKFELSGHIFEKCSNITFYENRSNGRRVAEFGHTDGRMDRCTDVTKLLVVFRSFATRLTSKRYDVISFGFISGTYTKELI